MRWKKDIIKEPQHKEVKTERRFLWFSMSRRYNNEYIEYRWLEFVSIKMQYNLGSGTWDDLHWIEDSDPDKGLQPVTNPPPTPPVKPLKPE